MPELFRLDIVVAARDFPLAEALVGQSVSHGWEEEELDGGRVLLRVHSESRQLILDLAQSVSAVLPEAGLQESAVAGKNWVEAWREYFTPVEAGDFVILPPWIPSWIPPGSSPAERAKTTVVIEPGSAFGTGHHPSTTLCLEALTRLRVMGLAGPGKRFLDLGTGSGVLGIACARLGMNGLGLDLDAEALHNARENRERNQAGHSLDLRQGSIGDLAGQRFDLVLANILANPLKEMAPLILDSLDAGASLVLSGILDTQADEVALAYASLGPASRLFAPSLADEPGQKPGVPHKPDHWACLYWTTSAFP